MPLDPEVLAGPLLLLVSSLPGYGQLTPTERGEVVRIAQGFACRDSAAATGRAPGTVRGWRTHLYSKLRVGGAVELQLTILSAALAEAGRGTPQWLDGSVAGSALTHLPEDAEQLRGLARAGERPVEAERPQRIVRTA